MAWGLSVSWQAGLSGPDRAYTGAKVEDPIQAAIYRIQTYQETKYACAENEATIRHLQAALEL